ncbi:hypothetical protein DVH24_008953 [Malus domestica]|uniref:Uncharacterized protein n=1 Tax=Malus domestica TaxID=3750 RepID=A0A498JKJ4_MALDO|nr:hypothetical protein DVH24_008953 [Malus domestica]
MEKKNPERQAYKGLEGITVAAFLNLHVVTRGEHSVAKRLVHIFYGNSFHPSLSFSLISLCNLQLHDFAPLPPPVTHLSCFCVFLFLLWIFACNCEDN